MSAAASPAGGSLVIPEWGYDHLVLADWRTSVLRFQPRDDDGRQPSIFKTGYRTSAGVDLTVRLERGAATDFPTAQDDDVLLGLLYLTHVQGFPDVVRFLPDQLTRIIRWPRNDRSYKRIATALDRYKKLSATFHHNWYSKKDRAIKLQLMTGIVAQAEVVTRRGRRAAKAQPESHVQWTENFATSLREGNVLPINLRLLYGWSRPGAKQLHRQLNKTWRGGQKPTIYERDLRELACGHLGMTDSKSLKRNFHQVVIEMERKGYLTPMAFNERYLKISAGIWRARFELHPDHAMRATARPAAKARAIDYQRDAQGLVGEYHRARFGRASHEPRPRELEHARELIAAFGFDAVSAVTTDVGRTVRGQNKDDLYFGFAVPYFRKALESAAAGLGFRQQLSSRSTAAHADQDRFHRQSLERQRRRELLLLAWSKATARERDRFRETALERADSETARRRIRTSTLDEPAPEILQEFARATGEGESARQHS